MGFAAPFALVTVITRPLTALQAGLQLATVEDGSGRLRFAPSCQAQ